MRILVTGAAGFVGRHAVRALRDAGHEVIATDIASAVARDPGETLRPLDICDAAAWPDILSEARPEGLLHLGGIAFVPLGWTDPARVLKVNLLGSLHLLEALRHHAPETRLLLVSSAEIYGRAGREGALDESTPPAPDNPYAIAKAAADEMTLLYARRYGLPFMTARPGNHIGPGQSEDFAAASFARQLADSVVSNRPPVLHVGNLDARRDFTDVRDIVRAYGLILERGEAGKAYNIASGRPIPVREILDGLIRVSKTQPRIERDPQRYRPADDGPSIDCKRLRETLGWEPSFSLEQTLHDIYRATLEKLAGGS